MAILPWSLRLPALMGLASAVLFGQPAVAETVSKRLAVLELKGEIVSGEVREALADEIRGGAVEGLADRGVQVMTRENMMVLLKEMGKKDCSEGDCEVETARNIGADFVVSGSVVRIDASFVVTLKLHETKGGSLLATDRIEAKSQLEVSRHLREHGRTLVANNIGFRPAPPPVALARAPEPAPAAAPPPPHPAAPAAPGCAANQMPIPGGTFWMGDLDLGGDSTPVHKVTLSPFCMDRTEVTVAAYRACVENGGCPPASASVDWEDIKPIEKTRWSQFCTWGKSGFDQHPINCVDWKQASAYCDWTGGRLPTEAEWEFAACGTDGRIYPWGNEAPDATTLNACGSECASVMKRLDKTLTPMYAGDDGWPATASVGSFPKDASPFGVLDMAGNVGEWTSEPDGPVRECRGGWWYERDPAAFRAAFRYGWTPVSRLCEVGFRCARDMKPKAFRQPRKGHQPR